jgi:hypothetical protein
MAVTSPAAASAEGQGQGQGHRPHRQPGQQIALKQRTIVPGKLTPPHPR